MMYIALHLSIYMHLFINSNITINNNIIQLNEKGAYIDKFYYSPFYKLSKYRQYRKGANLRKPNVGLFKLATKDFEIIKEKSYFVGDKESDRLAARKFKIKYINVDNETNLYSLLLKELRL